MIRPFTKSFICRIALGISLFFTTQNLIAQNWNQIKKVVASDRSKHLNFGNSVAISNDYAIIGGVGEGEYFTGPNPLNNASAAYIFKQTGATWTQEAKIQAMDRDFNDAFGQSVAISGDCVVVGAPLKNHIIGSDTFKRSGAAYIFKRTGSTWTQEAKIVASDRGAGDEFGVSVSISGNFIIVGAWLEDENITGGNTLTNAGSAYIFRRTGATWTQEAKIVASDRGTFDYFGSSVSMNGDYAIIGAYQEAEDATGGNRLLQSGSAYIFKRIGSTWAQEAKIVASDRERYDWFGSSVSINGEYAIVGAFREREDATGGSTLDDAGSAYIFKRTGTSWTQEAKIVASDRDKYDWFGGSVAINGDCAIVSSVSEGEISVSSLRQTGAVYIFKRIGASWIQEAKIVASDRAWYDRFGVSVAIGGGYALIGAFLEDENATGDSTLTNAGSAYFFQRQISNAATDIDNHDLKIYPNPVSTTLKIETESVSEYQISNILGQPILRGQISSSVKDGIDVSTLVAGTYILKVGQMQMKFVKQ